MTYKSYKSYEVHVWTNGSKEWYLNGQLHREDGPAIEWAGGTKSWWLNGALHREDGPAIERADGTKEWWLNGNRVSEADVMGCSDKIVEIGGKRYKLQML